MTVPNNVHVSTDPFHDFLIVDTTQTERFQTMPTHNLIHLYTDLLLKTDNLSLTDTIDTEQVLSDGLTTLQLCSDILIRPSHPRNVLFYLSDQDAESIVHFSKALDVIFETSDWIQFERETLATGDFETSPVVWAIMLGPRGLMEKLVRGKKGAAAALEAEDEWVKVQDGDEGVEHNNGFSSWFAGEEWVQLQEPDEKFEKNKEALKWFVAELVKMVEEVRALVGQGEG